MKKSLIYLALTMAGFYFAALLVGGCKTKSKPPVDTKAFDIHGATITWTVPVGVSTGPVRTLPQVNYSSAAAVTEQNIVVFVKPGETVEVPIRAPSGEKFINDFNAREAAKGVVHPNETVGLDKVGLNSWKSKANWQNTGSQIVYLRYPTKAVYGQTIDIRYTVQGLLDWSVKAGAEFVANLKIFRLWPEGVNYVNIYEGQSPKTQECHLFAENLKYLPVPGLTPWKLSHRSMNYLLVKKMFDGQKHEVIRTIKLPSGLGKNDGRWTVTLDGYTVIDVQNLQVNDAAHPKIPNIVFIQVDISNHKQPASSYVNFFDVTVGVR